MVGQTDVTNSINLILTSFIFGEISSTQSINTVYKL